jgi:hypothetical protein
VTHVGADIRHDPRAEASQDFRWQEVDTVLHGESGRAVNRLVRVRAPCLLQTQSLALEDILYMYTLMSHETFLDFDTPPAVVFLFAYLHSTCSKNGRKKNATRLLTNQPSSNA